MENKRGQVTLFVIAGIFILVLGVLIYFFMPRLQSNYTNTNNPNEYMQGCLEKSIEENLKIISSQGGKLEPEFYYEYNNEKIEYLCYTEEYYKTCIVHQPLLIGSVKQELANSIKEKSNECFNQMKSSFENKGFKTNLKIGEIQVDFFPKNVVVNFDTSFSLEKENVENYDSFKINVKSGMYDLLAIATSIIDFETTYGDSETTVYMDYFRDVKVEKNKLSSGTTIYTLKDRNTLEEFKFASRSLVYPAGYGGNQVLIPAQ
jgi:hypothetical protein